MIFILFFSFLVFVAIIITCFKNKNTVVTRCQSSSCKHNNQGLCKRKDIFIYDNEVLGICLNHTELIEERFSKIFDRAVTACIKSGHFFALTDKDKRFIEDLKAIKDVGDFRKLMKRHGL
jgi:hypothetical protein